MTDDKRPSLVRRILVAVGVLLAVATSTPSARAGASTTPVDPDSQLVGCDQADEPITITVSSHLDPTCTYTKGISITASDVTLDCLGAHIKDLEGTLSRGVVITAPTDVELAGVTVRNCSIQGFLNNIRVTRDGFKDLAEGAEYDHPFADIVIEDSVLESSRGSGIFVDGYVTDVTMRNLDIFDSGGVGIYLEAGSKDNLVEGNRIRNNGFGDVTPEGIPIVVGGIEFRYLSTGREGIAIDGSRNNIIRNNRISANSAGAIFLYKNCGEYVTERPNGWWPRRYGADGNIIENNVIRDEKQGVWIGSRMAENTYFMDCSDPSYVSSPLRAVHLDYAKNNVVRGNTLANVGYGVRVEDDGNRVEANRFTSANSSHQAILVGTKERTEVLGWPVTGSVILDNQATIAGNDDPYRWIHPHEATQFSGNSSRRTVRALVAGEQPTINFHLFVLAIWVAP